MKLRLNNNQLKMIALITMTIDHVGMLLFPRSVLLRIIGRLAFPIFAYMIAEGCAHTRSMGRYLGTMAAMAAIYQLVYFFVDSSLYQSILVTFSLSIALIWVLQWAEKRKTAAARACLVLALMGVSFVTRLLPKLLDGTDFDVDYGLWGVLLPVAIYLAKEKWQKLLWAACVLSLLALESYYLQWYALAALPLLALYDGTRGKWKMKWLFYIYYPAHLVALWSLQRLIY